MAASASSLGAEERSEFARIAEMPFSANVTPSRSTLPSVS